MFTIFLCLFSGKRLTFAASEEKHFMRLLKQSEYEKLFQNLQYLIITTQLK